jgi:proline-specific peptidase
MKFVLVAMAFFGVMSAVPAYAQLAHAQPEWYLPTGDGCSLFVQEFGRGPETLVILHGGWGAEHSYLFDAFKGLDTKYHLVFYDQRGSLLSPCPAEKISVQKHVDDLERLRAALGLAQINIVAHSMGTYLAMEYQQQHPDRVKGLVLMGSMIPETPKTDAENQLLQQQQAFTHQFMGRPEIAAELHQEGLDKDPKTMTPKEETNAWHIHFAAVNIYHLDRWQQVKGGRAFYNTVSEQAAAKTMTSPWDFTEALAARHCPTWVIDGDHDLVDPSGRSFRAATANMPGVRVVVIKDAGHLSWIDAPGDFSKVLQSALENTTQCALPEKSAH